MSSAVSGAVTVRDVVAGDGVHSVFQPVVDLDSGRVVAYEALARGPRGTALEHPDALFAAARAEDALAELDQACSAAALRGASRAGLVSPLTLFVNLEPAVLDGAPVEQLLALAQQVPGNLRVVVELTERALAQRPAELLRTVARVRELGWGVALDDVGADPVSLAFMSLLRPDVVKLDLRLVQARPGPGAAQIMHAVGAYAQSTGAAVVAEGVEDEAHLRMARGLGAHLGQGWLFGYPQSGPAAGYEAGELPLLASAPLGAGVTDSPFELAASHAQVRRAPKALLVELTRHLEREALRLGDTAVVAATFQGTHHFTPATASRYRDLVERTAFVCAIGQDVPPEPVPGLRGAALAPTDPLCAEWDVVVTAPHFSAALLARDLGEAGPDADRSFDYVLTYERQTVLAAAHALISRVAPRAELPAAPGHPTSPAHPAARTDLTAEATTPPVAAPGAGAPHQNPVVPETLLHRALGATPSGVSIVDMRRADQPLVYVNTAFEQLAGLRAEDLLGRNCRVLQSPDTDPRQVAAIREAIAAGREWHGTLLNTRGPERTPWWNEIHLAPVTDEHGRVAHYIGIQNDVTATVETQRALDLERERASSYLARIEHLARTDPLTGLANRRHAEDRVREALSATRSTRRALALLFCDLDGFKAVNDAFGHATGDALLLATAHRLRARVPAGDVIARLGGDEFLVALLDLQPGTVQAHATRLAEDLARTTTQPLLLHGHEVAVGMSIGVSVFPDDGEEFSALLHSADQRMYTTKHRHRHRHRAQPTASPPPAATG